MLDASASDKKGNFAIYFFYWIILTMKVSSGNIVQVRRFIGMSSVVSDDSDSDCSENELQITERIQHYSEEDTNQ